MLGAVWGYRKGHIGASADASATIEVERVLPDGRTLHYDSIVPGAIRADTVESRWAASAMVGVTTPLVPRWTPLAITVGVGLTDPRHDWFLGASLLRPLGWLTTQTRAGALAAEGLPVDVHLLAHLGRTDVLASSESCEAEEGLSPCRTTTVTRLKGIVLAFSVDAGTLLTEAIKKLGI